jgi:preprotein translocase subunit SecA
LITRSIEGAQKRVELQNFQARKRLLDYDDVMNQQREVIYSLRSFALEGGEELKGEAIKMIDKGVTHRVSTTLAEYEDAAQWDFDLLRQDLLMHYLLSVPEFDQADKRPTDDASAQRVAVEAAKKAFWAKLESLDAVRDEMGQPYGDRLLSLVMLNVLDEKWKDHLYDLDQLRNAIHYRSSQKDPPYRVQAGVHDVGTR